MAEFKKLSDVEVVAEPAESANVLIEEDGVIKKAPKTAVGGAGGASGGIVIHFTVNSDDEIEEAPVFDFNEIRSSILNGINVICFKRNYDGEYYSFAINFIEDTRIIFARGEDQSFYLYSDNTVEYSC